MSLQIYRLSFLPFVVALIALAFSLEPMPDPIEPGPVQAAFDAGNATTVAKQIEALGTREPGSAADAEAADVVAAKFGAIPAVEVNEQQVPAEVNGEETEVTNVIATIPGRGDGSVLVVASRDSKGGPGGATSAAATGVLTELAGVMGGAGHERTLVFASTSGSQAGAPGTRDLIERLDPRPEAVVVISQPGAAPQGPFLTAGSTEFSSPSAQLVVSAEDFLRDQAEVTAGRPGLMTQLAALAIPAGLGDQSAANGDGADAVAIGAAGEMQLPGDYGEPDEESIDRFGRTAAALIGALDVAPAPPVHGPDTYVRVGDNLIGTWVIGLLALALLLPAGTMSIAAIAMSRPPEMAAAAAWIARWIGVALIAPLTILFFGLIGIIATPPFPFDPASLSLGAGEALVLLFAAALSAAGAWFGLHGRRPAGVDRRSLSACAGAAAVIAVLMIWLVNPIFALFVALPAHLWLLAAVTKPPRVVLFVALVIAAWLPFLLVLVELAGRLDSGFDLPWHLTVMAAGGQLPVLIVAAFSVLAWAVAAGLAAITAPQPSPPKSSRARRHREQSEEQDAQSGRLSDIGIS